MTAPAGRRRQSHAPDGAAQHRGWLGLVEISGPFLSLPVLRQAWPTLDALEKPTREALRREHAIWRDTPEAGQAAWVRWVLAGLLSWGDELRESAGELDDLAMDVAEHDTRVVPSFALVEPDEDVKPATTKLLGLVCPPGHSPTARVPGSPWSATYVDRLAVLCRHHGVELGLVTDGRWWALVWAPKDTATGTAVFDAIAWPEAAERDVVRAFTSLLVRSRFFGMRDAETLPALLHASLGSQEDITEALGSQVREAVELLVAALGREDLAARERGAPSLDGVDAHEVYRGAVSVMMRIVFLLFAEERRLLPADNDLYASTYSTGQLCSELERRALEGSEDDLEYTTVGWHRLLAVFAAVHGGIDHPRLTMHAHDGSLFDPGEHPWLNLPVDDRTVLHMLRAVQYVEIGTGRLRERRSLSFRSLGVEEIGYVYEGLLAYDAFRAAEVVVGLAGKRGQEPEIELRELEKIASAHTDLSALGGELSSRFPNTGLGTAPAIAKKMRPLTGAAAEGARRKLLAAAQGDAKLADRLTVFFGLLRQDLRELPLVIQPGALYVTDSPRRRDTGTHYTPRELAEEVVLNALEPLVYEPGPLQTADASEWKLKSSKDIVALKVADIAMGSAAFLVAATRYLGARLIEAWTREGDARAQAYAISDVQSDADPIVVDAHRKVIEHCLYGVDINPMAVEMAKLSLWLVSMDPYRPFTFLDDRLVTGDSLLGITSLEQLKSMHLNTVEGKRVHGDSDLFGWTGEASALIREAAGDREELAELSLEVDPIDRLEQKRVRLYEAWAKMDRLRLFADLLTGASLVGAGISPRAAPIVEAARLASGVSQGAGERVARESAKQWLTNDNANSSHSSVPICVHWPLTFPEVFGDDPGFDAVVGNPPFLMGRKISRAHGDSYRELLVEYIARGARGSADLCSYFVLRAHDLIKKSGQVGLVATNTLAQGDARQVALTPLEANGFVIRRAVRSRPWPGKNAALDYCIVWSSGTPLSEAATCVVDGLRTAAIGSDLRPVEAGANTSVHLLARNANFAFQGVIPSGEGFVLSPVDVEQILHLEKKSAEVIFPYLIGEVLNADPTCSADRFIINFRDWDESRASEYHECFKRVQSRVMPARQALNRTVAGGRWWVYERRRPAMQESIDSLKNVIVLAQVSSTAMPVLVRNSSVYDQQLVVFASEDLSHLALLSSAVHYHWALEHCLTKRSDLTYTPTTILSTFPFCARTSELVGLGRELTDFRGEVMQTQDIGLTRLYAQVSTPTANDVNIAGLRLIHRRIDEATVSAYGWGDRIASVGGLNHDFYKVGRETRYTIGPAARRVVLDSLLELNHERYAEEVAQGLHGKTKGGRAKKKQQEQEGMFNA